MHCRGLHGALWKAAWPRAETGANEPQCIGDIAVAGGYGTFGTPVADTQFAGVFSRRI